MIWTVVSKINQ